MKQKIIILTTIYLLFNSPLSAQNIEKMNNSELIEHIVNLITKIDSIKNDNINLQESTSKLSSNLSLLEQKNKTNDVEISRISELILKNENERKLIISENNIAISKLNEIIITLKDSLSSVQSSSNVVSTSTIYNNNDFLNKYYFNQIPLPNNSFSLVLSKLVYGSKFDHYNSYYNNENGSFKGAVRRLPEILDPNAFTIWAVKPNVKISRRGNPNNYVISKNSDYFNSKLPKIEVLRNKLFIIKYKDGSEESFLFNVKQNEPKNDNEENDNEEEREKLPIENNQRKILQIELANEEVKADGTNNTAKDIVWRFFAIENECYLALTWGQLDRLNLKLPFENTENEYITTGEEICFSRNKDLFMDNSEFIDPQEIIYLFKLK